jgi:hypothetical protein
MRGATIERSIAAVKAFESHTQDPYVPSKATAADLALYAKRPDIADVLNLKGARYMCHPFLVESAIYSGDVNQLTKILAMSEPKHSRREHPFDARAAFHITVQAPRDNSAMIRFLATQPGFDIDAQTDRLPNVIAAPRRCLEPYGKDTNWTSHQAIMKFCEPLKDDQRWRPTALDLALSNRNLPNAMALYQLGAKN